MASNNENNLLKSIPPVLPFSKEQKIEQFAHRVVTQQWLNASEQAKALNGGRGGDHLLIWKRNNR